MARIEPKESHLNSLARLCAHMRLTYVLAHLAELNLNKKSLEFHVFNGEFVIFMENDEE